MSQGLNRAMLIGFLGADPDLRFTSAGQAVLSMRLATTETFLDKDKVRRERTDWHACVVWGTRAEGLSKILTKGAQVFVEGSLRTSSWEKDGVKHTKTEVIATDVVLCGTRGDRSEADAEQDLEGAAHAPPAAGSAPRATSAPSGSRAVPSTSGAIASDADLDGKYGNPTVRFNPKRWEGDGFTGKNYSDCSPDFLDILAEALDYSADNPTAGKEKYVEGNRKDAARARGWAKRLRSGKAGSGGARGPAAPADAGGEEEAPDSIPF